MAELDVPEPDALELEEPPAPPAPPMPKMVVEPVVVVMVELPVVSTPTRADVVIAELVALSVPLLEEKSAF